MQYGSSQKSRSDCEVMIISISAKYGGKRCIKDTGV